LAKKRLLEANAIIKLSSNLPVRTELREGLKKWLSTSSIVSIRIVEWLEEGFLIGSSCVLDNIFCDVPSLSVSHR